MSKPNILIVEDERHISDLLEMNLSMEGYATQIARSIAEARHLYRKYPVELIVLDVMLPDGNGLEFCQEVKSNNKELPVLMLSALGQSHDRIKGLKSGADDYLPKPFNLEELLLRVEKLFTRFSDPTGQDAAIQTSQTNIGGQVIDWDKMTLHNQEQNHTIQLTVKEYELLRFLYQHKNKVVSRQDIIEEVWQMDQHSNTRTVDNYVSMLRKHLEPNIQKPQIIKTIRGVGYMLVVD